MCCESWKITFDSKIASFWQNSQASPSTRYPEGDFRVAQVAQDEVTQKNQDSNWCLPTWTFQIIPFWILLQEIAHFMQKQEMKSKRRSREFEGPSSWREHRAMISHHDRRAARDRQVRWRNNMRANSVANFIIITPTQRLTELSNRFFFCLVFSHQTFPGPTRETWLWGPSFSHWGFLPREPASQSHLRHTVTVSTRKSKAFYRL